MSTTSINVAVSADLLFAVVTDPTTYPYWLAGAKATLSVDEHWPEPGSEFRHEVGIGPFRVGDKTQSLAFVMRDRTLELKVRVRPFGRGKVRFRVEPQGLNHSTVQFFEEPLSLGLRVARPFIETLTEARNRRSLRALRSFVQASARPNDRAANERPLRAIGSFRVPYVTAGARAAGRSPS